MNQHFLEKVQIALGFLPVNMATGANTGDWASLAEFNRCAVVFCAGPGTAGQDPTLTLQQAKSAAGGTPKALNFTRIDVKQGSDLTAIGQFTTITQAAGNTYTELTAAENSKIWVVDVKAEDLDVNNGYGFIQGSIGDVGTNSQIGLVLYFPHDPRYQSKTLPSVLA